MENTLDMTAWQDFKARFDAIYSPAFKQVYGEETYEGHQIFACHAAFPVFFTPHLLYQIWANFKLYPATQSERMLNIPNFVVSDFLLSGLCRQLSPKLYTLDFDLRQQLLAELKADDRFGTQRIHQLATFLDQYHREAQTGVVEKSVATYHNWLVRTVREPDSLLEELRGKLEKAVDQQRFFELRKLNRILFDFQKTNPAFKPIANYSQLMDDYLITHKAKPGDGLQLKTVEMGPIKLPFYQDLDEKIAIEREIDSERLAFVPGKNKLYALLVGIDHYQSEEILALRGAKNDTKALEAFLEARTYPDSLRCQTLLDEEATREQIIQGFYQHLSKAGPGDVVLFYFSGHAAQEKAHPVFHEIEPDGLFETLVCYDSRVKGIPDLADVELEALFYLMDKKKPHICSILNGCYTEEDELLASSKTSDSFGETRASHPLDREADDYQESREPFVFFRREFAQEDSFQSSFQQAINTTDGRVVFPKATHIQIASTLSHEQDYEREIDGEMRSYFSCGLMDVLGNSRYVYSYEEVSRKLNNYLNRKGLVQTPHIRTFGDSDTDLPFLFGAMAPYQDVHFPVYWRRDNQSWVIDAGRAHGIPRIRSEERTHLAIFEEDSDTTDSHLAEASIEAVFYGQSVLGNISNETALVRKHPYKAIIRSLPIEKTRVYVNVSPAPKTKRKTKGKSSALSPTALKDRLRRSEAAVYYEIVENVNQAEYIISSQRSDLQIARATDQQLIVSQTDLFSLPQQLAAISRWDRTAGLRNPLSFIAPGQIIMELSSPKGEVKISQQREGSIALSYDPQQFDQLPDISVQISNQANKGESEAQELAITYYVALLILKPDFSIRATSAMAVEAGYPQRIRIFNELFLPSEEQERHYLFKLVISQTPFDASSLEQEGLEAYIPEINTQATNSLEALFHRAGTRAVEVDTEAELVDWTTDELRIVLRAETQFPEMVEKTQAEPTPEPLHLQLIRAEKEARTGRLDLGKCGLREWPAELFELYDLEELVMSNTIWNKRGEWNEGADSGENNFLFELPPQLEKLSNLQHLYIGGGAGEGEAWEMNDLSVLGNLMRLQTLDVSYTAIADISALAQLPSLQVLNLSRTAVRDLAPLRGLGQLQQLYLRESEVEDLRPLRHLLEKGIPIEWNENPSFEEEVKGFVGRIEVYGCPLLHPPLEVVLQGNEAILAYFGSFDADEAGLEEQDFSFLQEKDLARLLGEASFMGAEDALQENLLIYQTPRQQTWLITTQEWLVCLLDDEKNREAAKTIQWNMKLEDAQPITASPKSNYPNSGLLHIGSRKNWYYSLKLYPQAGELVKQIEAMVARGSKWEDEGFSKWS